MLAFAHIPTGTTTNNGFDIDEVNGRFVESVAPVTAIGADIRDRQGYTLRSGSGFLTIGVYLKQRVCESSVPLWGWGIEQWQPAQAPGGLP